VQTFLVVAGIVVAFGLGWAVGRGGRPPGQPVAPSNPVPVAPTSATPSFAEVVEEHPSGVVVAGRDGVITYRNAAAQAMSGTHVRVLLDEAVDRHVAAALSGSRSDEVLEMFGPPKVVFVVEARPMPEGGAVVFIEDISEQRRIDQVRTDFVANISHELKTPIGALSVLAETLEGETDPDTIERVVRRMMGEAERASRTIDDLTELSRIELSGEHEVEEVRVVEVVRGAVARVTELAAQRDICISTLGSTDGELTQAESLVIEGDRRQLVSAVGNLVENAVKYSESGGLVQVHVREHGGWLEIAVIDQGVGIPQRDLDRIFERFYRVDRARSRDTGGTGLGLSIVRHVATNHRGEIDVTSNEGEGSTFVLRLPMRGKNLAGPVTNIDRPSPVTIEGVA
jgi:two-component system sensor histidine kinase SenX3